MQDSSTNESTIMPGGRIASRGLLGGKYNINGLGDINGLADPELTTLNGVRASFGTAGT